MAMPSAVHPMLCTLVDEIPRGIEWLFETKWDGERIVAFVRTVRGKATVKLQSRTLKDNTKQYPEIVEELALRLSGHSAVIDGEIVALEADGRSNFELLAHRFGLTDPAVIRARMQDTPAWYMAFDLLWLDGVDLRQRPLTERRRLLKQLLAKCKRVKFSADLQDGTKLFSASERLGLEGIVGKRRNSQYREEVRGRDWLKMKVTWQQECVVGGWTEGKGRRAGRFGALLVGVYEKRGGKKVLIPVGGVGTGFDDEKILATMKLLKPLTAAKMPFGELPRHLNDTPHWVRPRLVAEVKFANWTADGQMRAPVFLGWRDDKKPTDCVREIVSPRPKKSPARNPGR